MAQVDLDVRPRVEPQRACALLAPAAQQLVERESRCGVRSAGARCPRAREAPRAGRCGRSSPSRCRARSHARARARRAGSRRRGSPPSSGRRRCARPRRRAGRAPSPFACVACTTVVRSPRQPVRASSSIGRTPCSAMHSSISRGCSSACTCKRQSLALGVRAELLEPVGRARTDGVRRDTDAHVPRHEAARAVRGTRRPTPVESARSRRARTRRGAGRARRPQLPPPRRPRAPRRAPGSGTRPPP